MDVLDLRMRGIGLGRRFGSGTLGDVVTFVDEVGLVTLFQLGSYSWVPLAFNGSTGSRSFFGFTGSGSLGGGEQRLYRFAQLCNRGKSNAKEEQSSEEINRTALCFAV